MAEGREAVKVKHAHLAQVRHPIKAARLLYSAPSIVLSGPIYLIFSICLAALVYSFWAKKDELVLAPLKLERESYTLEAVEGGMVARIDVREGQRVETLDPLIAVQATRVTAVSEGETLQSRLTDLREQLDTLTNEYEHNRRQLELSLRNVAKDRTLMERQLATARDNVRFLGGKLDKARESFKTEQRLFQSNDITRQEFERAKAKVDDLEKQVRDAKAEVEKITVSLNALSEDKIQNELAQAKERFETQKERLERQVASTEEQIREEELLIRGMNREGTLTSYTSTFPGLVTQVHVKPGNLIGAGTPLVTIVKESAALEARVLVPNKDIGRLQKGQSVQIKYFAYPYQEYGIPTGVISDISTKPSGLPGQESMYVVRVALNQETISKRGERPKRLDLGLEGIAEVKTGEKRFIELVFSPISRFFTQEDE